LSIKKLSRAMEKNVHQTYFLRDHVLPSDRRKVERSLLVHGKKKRLHPILGGGILLAWVWVKSVLVAAGEKKKKEEREEDLQLREQKKGGEGSSVSSLDLKKKRGEPRPSEIQGSAGPSGYATQKKEETDLFRRQIQIRKKKSVFQWPCRKKKKECL